MISQKRELESDLAMLLQSGTLVALATIIYGWIGCETGVGGGDEHAIFAGICLMVALPILRLAMMVFSFLSERNFKLAGVAAAVIAIIAFNFGLGVHMSAQKHRTSQSR